MIRTMLVFVLLLLFAIGPTRADETIIQLKAGAGLDAVEGNCGACHSLDYILMNSPIQDQKGWTATVTKMVKALGAPITAEDQKVIIAYLSANYAKK